MHGSVVPSYTFVNIKNLRQALLESMNELFCCKLVVILCTHMYPTALFLLKRPFPAEMNVNLKKPYCSRPRRIHNPKTRKYSSLLTKQVAVIVVFRHF
jgi:hypothetical protein